MMRHYLKAKIHRATVTGADPDYEGSITIDRALLERAGMDPYELKREYQGRIVPHGAVDVQGWLQQAAPSEITKPNLDQWLTMSSWVLSRLPPSKRLVARAQSARVLAFSSGNACVGRCAGHHP